MSRDDGHAKIRRGAAPRKRVIASKPRRPTKKKKSQTSQALALIPAPVAAAAKRAAGWGLAALAVGLVGAGFIAMKLPQMVGIEIGEVIGNAGFAVRQVEITGLNRMDRKPIEDAAFDQQARAMPLVDIGDIRERLLKYGWVEDARVSRRLPDTLVIDIVERKPAAMWQHQRRLMLIDAAGREIEQVKFVGSPLPDLPIVIGPQANYQLAALTRLMEGAPALKPMLDGATWIGFRRWDIRFRSGETLSLPEGETQARAALIDFAERDGTARLLGRGITRFDMRIPGKLVVRMPKREGESATAASPVQPRLQARTVSEPPPPAAQETTPPIERKPLRDIAPPPSTTQERGYVEAAYGERKGQ